MKHFQRAINIVSIIFIISIVLVMAQNQPLINKNAHQIVDGHKGPPPNPKHGRSEGRVESNGTQLNPMPASSSALPPMPVGGPPPPPPPTK